MNFVMVELSGYGVKPYQIGPAPSAIKNSAWDWFRPTMLIPQPSDEVQYN